ncbi:MAG: hypothetical protein D6773_11860 [Alphaproteobacteria bacterium]|nr:MAG: hypothetical protein D6773_11860 [Alphaproteobacteria bacterium]
MSVWEVIYIRHGRETPEGYKRTGGLAGTHHGQHADIAVRPMREGEDHDLIRIPGHGYIRA